MFYAALVGVGAELGNFPFSENYNWWELMHHQNPLLIIQLLSIIITNIFSLRRTYYPMDIEFLLLVVVVQSHFQVNPNDCIEVAFGV